MRNKLYDGNSQVIEQYSNLKKEQASKRKTLKSLTMEIKKISSPRGKNSKKRKRDAQNGNCLSQISCITMAYSKLQAMLKLMRMSREFN